MKLVYHRSGDNEKPHSVDIVYEATDSVKQVVDAFEHVETLFKKRKRKPSLLLGEEKVSAGEVRTYLHGAGLAGLAHGEPFKIRFSMRDKFQFRVAQTLGTDNLIRKILEPPKKSS